jgi:16S rRNA (uracil1498-N3)-methyltransferase
MSDRYFTESPIAGPITTLAGPEAHHLIHVMRAKPGIQVTLFDGSGAEFQAEIRRVGRSEVELEVLAVAAVDREPPVPIVLGVTLPKGDRQKWLVEKAVELGVGRLVPLWTARSVAQGGLQATDRLRRTVVEASKQCGRNRLMEIAPPQDWAEWIAGGRDAPVRLLAHPERPPAGPAGAHDAARGAVDLAPCGTGPVLLAVGPEGGFTSDEVALAVAAGWRPIDLGPRILRIETAAILLVAVGLGFSRGTP